MAKSILIDFALSFLELPFFAEWFLVIPLEEILEQLISSLLVRNQLKLTLLDRLLGLIPIPGVTAVSIRTLRSLLK